MLGKHSGWRNPSWIDNDTVMISDPTHALNYDVILDTLSDGDSGNLVKGWFSDMVDNNPHVSGGDITRDHTSSRRDRRERQHAHGLPRPAVPDRTSRTAIRRSRRARPSATATAGPPAHYSTPTFSPDGGRLAWAEDDGIMGVTVPSFAGGCTLDGATPNAPLRHPRRLTARLGPGRRAQRRRRQRPAA